MHRRGFVNIFAVIGLLLVLGTVGYIFVSKGEPQQALPHDATITLKDMGGAKTSALQDTSDWKTYVDTKYGVEFKYPPKHQNIPLKGGSREGQTSAFTIKDSYGNDASSIVLSSHDLNSFQYTDYTSGGKYIFDSKNKTWGVSSDASDGTDSKILHDLTPSSLQLPFEAYKYSGGSGFCVWDSYFTPLRSKGIMLELEYSVCGDPPTSEEMSTFDRVSPLLISSFKFTN